MTSLPHRLALVAVTVATVLAASRLAIPPSALGADAEDLIREGIALRRKGDDLGALQRFERAYQIDRSPRIVAQMGLAEQALGRWAEAYDHLTRALDAKTDPWIGKNQAALSAALDTVGEHVGRLELLGGTHGAEVRVNGVVRGKVPLSAPLALAIGTVVIDVTLPGHLSLQRVTVIKPGQTTRESLDASVPLAKADLTNATRTSPNGQQQRSAPEGPISEASPSNEEDQSTSSAGADGTIWPGAKWIAFGVGSIGLAVGIAGYLGQREAGSRFNANCGIDPTTHQPQPRSSNVTASWCLDRQTDVDRNYKLELGGFIAAGALAATGVVLWLLERDARPDATTASYCSPGAISGKQLSMTCGIRF